MDALKRLVKSRRLLTTTWPVVDPTEDSFLELWKLPHYVSLQIDARLAVISARLDLLLGNREESLNLLAGLYRLGQSMTAEGMLIQRLIGTAIRNITTSGLEDFVLNACETPEDYEKCWTVLERLHQVPGQEGGQNLLDGEWIAPLLFMKDTGGAAMPNTAEAVIRLRVADLRFQLVRMAAAARAQCLLTREFPHAAMYFAPYLPDGPPEDVFSGKPLRFTEPGIEPYAVYSVGPDEEDNSAAIDYSPTNGTTSVGDLVVRIPRERRFPFPKEGVHAANAAELLGQFPNGLPVDLVADPERSLALSIFDSTKEGPVRVFSFGPKGDRDSWSSNLVAYEIPGMKRIDFGSKDREKHGLVQKVYSPEVLSCSPSDEGPWTLGPRYDPTNGLKSDGQIFIEIPR